MIDAALFIYTETSLHAGTGSTVSAVDLPIQRERTTRHPLVQGSGIKGALRSQLRVTDNQYEKIVFGPSPEDMRNLRNNDRENDTHAGALSVGDARIVLFPVRSLAGVYAYTTCPMLLARLSRTLSSFPRFPQNPPQSGALVTPRSSVAVGGQVVLEEFAFNAKSEDSVGVIATWLAKNALPQSDEYAYWREKLLTSLVILNDDDFTEFTVNSTEIVTRVRIDSAKKTVAKGALWTQESLPSDTLLLSNITISTPRDGSKVSESDLGNWLATSLGSRVQIGGDETTGQGFVALRWL